MSTQTPGGCGKGPAEGQGLVVAAAREDLLLSSSRHCSQRPSLGSKTLRALVHSGPFTRLPLGGLRQSSPPPTLSTVLDGLDGPACPEGSPQLRLLGRVLGILEETAEFGESGWPRGGPEASEDAGEEAQSLAMAGLTFSGALLTSYCCCSVSYYTQLEHTKWSMSPWSEGLLQGLHCRLRCHDHGRERSSGSSRWTISLSAWPLC